MTGKACLAQDGHDIICTPLDLIPKDFKISYPALTSSIGSAERDTLIVSPIPFINNCPIPIDDLILPVIKPPASVIPRCKG